MTQPFLLLEIKPTEPKTNVYRKIWTCMFSGIFHDSQKAEMTQISINWQMDKWNAIHIPAAATAAKSLQSCLTLCDPVDGGPLSLGFSRQEHWSGLPFPSPMHGSEKRKWSRSVMPETLSDPMDCSLPGPSVHGIFQARVLEWGAMLLKVLNNYL